MDLRSRMCVCAGVMVAALALSLVISGCGAQIAVACKINTIGTAPRIATLSHSAAPPGNMQHFDAFIQSGTSGCLFVASSLTNVTWSVSDQVSVNCSNAHDETNGTATCRAPSPVPITVTATAPAGDGTLVSHSASLTCN